MTCIEDARVQATRTLWCLIEDTEKVVNPTLRNFNLGLKICIPSYLWKLRKVFKYSKVGRDTIRFEGLWPYNEAWIHHFQHLRAWVWVPFGGDLVPGNCKISFLAFLKSNTSCCRSAIIWNLRIEEMIMKVNKNIICHLFINICLELKKRFYGL